MKVNILLAYLSAIILTFFSLKGHAQAYTDVTYHFEPEILNQFTVMETGAGALGEGSPLAVEWYTHMHKGYMAYAYMPTSSKLANREVFRRKTQEEVKYAARVDSDAVHRRKVRLRECSISSWLISTRSYSLEAHIACIWTGVPSTTVLTMPSKPHEKPI